MINIGKYIEMAINWLTENFTLFFDAINVGIGGFIDGFQNVLMWIPFYITIVLLTLLAWYKSGKGVGGVYRLRVITYLEYGILE